MAAISPTDYEQWRVAQVQEALRPFQGQKQTAPVKKKQAQAIEPYPTDLLSCLTKDTAWWKGHGWSQPPGSQRVLYWRRSDALQVGVPTAPRLASAQTVTTMLLAITTASGNRSALPPVTRTLPQAELFHRAIVGCVGNGHKVHCPELTGKDEAGTTCAAELVVAGCRPWTSDWGCDWFSRSQLKDHCCLATELISVSKCFIP